MAFKEFTTSRQEPLLARETGFNGTVTTASPTIVGSWFDVTGCNSLCLDVKFVFAAGTTILLTFQYSPDGGTTVYNLSSISVSAGTGTRTVYTDSFATGSANATYDIRLTDLDFNFFRVSAAITAGTTDTLTISGRRSYKA